MRTDQSETHEYAYLTVAGKLACPFQAQATITEAHSISTLFAFIRRLSRMLSCAPLVLLALLALPGCVTPNATHSMQDNANLNAYSTVFIAPLNYGGVYGDNYGVQAHVRQRIEQKGLRVLSEDQFRQQSDMDKLRSLFCIIQHNHTPDMMGGSYATVSINLQDFTQTVIYSGTGRYQGLTVGGDLKGATDQALKGFLDRYSGFDSAVEPRAVALVASRAKDHESPPGLRKSAEELRAYCDTNSLQLGLIEGIWTDNESKYEIGIFKREQKDRSDFVGLVLRTDNPFWKPGQIKMVLHPTAYASLFNASYHLSDHSTQGTTAAIDEAGILNLEVKDANGSPQKIAFIKNYPPVLGNTKSPQTATPHGKSQKTTGSGFVLTKSGLVVCNYHVVDSGSKITIVMPGQSKRFTATKQIQDKKNDLVILKMEDFHYDQIYSGEIPYSIADTRNVQLGEEVFTIGYPLGSLLGKSPKLSSGIISSIYGIDDDPRVYQISAPIQPGNSGSPLFNRKGELVGIVVATLNAKYLFERADVIPQNVNFAVKSSYLLNLTSMVPDGPEITTRKSLVAGKSLEQQVESLAPFTVTIEVE